MALGVKSWKSQSPGMQSEVQHFCCAHEILGSHNHSLASCPNGPDCYPDLPNAKGGIASIVLFGWGRSYANALGRTCSPSTWRKAGP